MKDYQQITNNLGRLAALSLMILAGVAVAAIALFAPYPEHVSFARPAAAAQQAPKCSNTTIAGSYAVTSEGWVPNGPPPTPMVPFATLSRMTLDGLGAVTNEITVARNGVIVRGVDQGTYSVGENCRGTMVLNAAALPAPLEFDLVVTEHGRGFKFISTNGGGVVNHEAVRLHAGQ